jgi:TusA-related sulfurtransferase
MPKTINVEGLEYPKNLAWVSHNIRPLKGGEILEVFHKEDFVPVLQRWSEETGNPIKEQEKNRTLLVRGKGFHGVCLSEKLSFYLTGVKLHAKEFLFKLTGKYPPFLFNFVSINEGLKGIEVLKSSPFSFEVLPSPKEVEGYCGFAVGFKDLETCQRVFEFLLTQKVGVEKIFRKEGKGYKILKGAWEY